MAVTTKSYTVVGGSLGPYTYPFDHIDDGDVAVTVNGALQTVTTHYTLDSTNKRITFTSGSVSTGDSVIIYRDTTEDPITNTFVAGSTIRSNELNDNFKQLLFIAQETDNQAMSSLTTTTKGTLTIGEDQVIKFEGATSNDHETTFTVIDPTADRTISLPNTSGTVVTTGDNGTVTSTMIADGTIDTADIKDNAVNAVKIHEGAVQTAKLANNAVTSDKITDGNVTTPKLGLHSVTTDKIVPSNVTTATINNGAVTTDKLADTAVNAAKIHDGSVQTDKLANLAVTNAKIASRTIANDKLVLNSITSSELANNSVGSNEIIEDAVTGIEIAGDAVSGAHIGDNVINTEHYANTSVGTAALANNAVTNDKILNRTIANNKLVAGSITSTELANDAVTNDKIADADLKTLAGMQAGTASVLAGGTALQATLTEINTICDGKGNQTTITDSDAHYPTSGAVVDYVAAQIAPIGGLEVIATDAVFPNTQPVSGVVISIADAGGLVVNGSGTSTTGRTVGGSTVTINGINSAYNSSTVTAGVGFLVTSTGSGQIYNFHKSVIRDQDILSISSDIDDFANRYRVGSSNPTSANDAGDLFFNTSTDKMLVRNAANSSWDEVQSVGNFFINTISSYSGTGGNSATFNGTAYRFVLSNAGTVAEQHIVSINGVVQKPNSGTSQPSEGFAIDGSSIIFSGAPATNSNYHIITIGAAVNIGTPSNNTVSTAVIQNGAVTGEKIATNLDLIDNKKIRFGTDIDLEIYHDGNHSYIKDAGTGAIKLIGEDVRLENASGNNIIKANGNAAELFHTGNKKLETTSGGVTFTGSCTSANSSGKFRGEDNVKLSLGDSEDLQIYHNGSHSYIDEAGTGDLYIRSASNIRLTDTSDNKMILCQDGGEVQLYYDGTEKAHTTTTGLRLDDSDKLEIGTSADLQIYHTGSQSRIENAGTGELRIQADTIQITDKEANDMHIECNHDGSVELYYDNSEKIRTTSTGFKTIGNAQFDDARKVVFGDGQDLEIYHNGSNNASYILEKNALMRFSSDGFGFESEDHSESLINGAKNGAVSLYYDNSKKFETRSDGALVTGEILASNGANIWGGQVDIAHSGNQTLTALRCSNDNVHASADCRVQVAVAANAGGDPYIHFDSGGSNMVVGQRWVGTTNNYLCLGSGDSPNGGVAGLEIDGNGHLRPDSNNARDLGSSSNRWRNIYTQDLQLSNEGQTNDVDGTWGNFTIQEGEDDLFLLNRRNGKKYKFNLTEIV